ncbi:MAG: hypothetical protein HY898_02255 [Deltaproteobacteria bacterium]|nr:hypothetical protein [Deltaproteobacteria bacterium]
MSRTRVDARTLRRLGLDPRPRLVGSEAPAQERGPLRPAAGAVVIGPDGRCYTLVSELAGEGEWLAQPIFPLHLIGAQHDRRIDVRGCAILPWPAARAVLIAGLFKRARQSPGERE